MAKYLKLIMIPEPHGSVRRWRINKKHVVAIMTGLALVIGVLSYFTAHYFSLKLDHDELQRLRVMTSDQRQEFQRLTADVERLHQELGTLAASEAQLRKLASLDEEIADIPVAIGGQPEPDLAEVDALQRQINALQVDIELRRQGQQALRNHLNDQILLSRATPSGWPARGWLSSYFGKRKSPFTGHTVMHEGIDFAANVGTPVTVTADGVVSRVEYSPTYGRAVAVDHGYGYQTFYAHNSKVLVKVGQRLKRGDEIARVGNTGQSTGSHLHYEVHLNGVPIDPRPLL